LYVLIELKDISSLEIKINNFTSPPNPLSIFDREGEDRSYVLKIIKKSRRINVKPGGNF
jgi:hypothetical protein